MEFPNLGVQCSVADCQQLDFLPYECACEQIFCGNHFNAHQLVCPLRKDVTVTEPKALTDFLECSHPKCKVSSIILIECPMCGKNLCVRHRHVNDCGEKKVIDFVDPAKVAANKFNEAKAAVDKELDANLAIAKKKPRTSQTANKVQLMRLKQKAIGAKSIPVVERTYFLIDTPKSLAPQRNVPIFISHSWTVGRAIDSVAEHCGVNNTNNKKDAPKLRLFRKNDGMTLGDPAVVVEALLKQEQIANGDSLVLEYVDDGVLQLEGY